MAKLILKSIAYYPQALAELPMSHKDLGLIDTDKPYKKLIIPTKSRHLYRLVDQQTGEVLKAQKLIRDHNDLKVYVGDVMGTVSYQWQVSSNNSDWTDIATATNSNFTLTQAQTGQYVRVKASYTDGYRHSVRYDCNSGTDQGCWYHHWPGTNIGQWNHLPEHLVRHTHGRHSHVHPGPDQRQWRRYQSERRHHHTELGFDSQRGGCE